jgi:hypothetical protein
MWIANLIKVQGNKKLKTKIDGILPLLRGAKQEEWISRFEIAEMIYLLRIYI